MNAKPVQFSSIITKNSVCIIINGSHRALPKNSDRGRKLIAALKKTPQDMEEIAVLVDAPSYIAVKSFGRVVIDGHDQLRLDGKVVDYGLTSIILQMVTEGFDADKLAKFLENVDRNPDKAIATHLYSFLEKGGMPITEDGCFHAFKRVKDNYESFHTGFESVQIVNTADAALSTEVIGNIPHKLGTILYMDRDDCNPDRNQTCSVGLHACSYDYLGQYCNAKGRIMIVKINPAYVVAIPNDYNDTKLRCHCLEVVGEISEDAAKDHFVADEVDDFVGSLVDDGTEVIEALLDSITEDLAEDEHDMTLDEVTNFGHDDAKAAHSLHMAFACDPVGDGLNYDKIPERFLNAYIIAYSKQYLHLTELHPYHSKAAYDAGYTDGQKEALEDHEEGEFNPTAVYGAQFCDVGDANNDPYGFGYVTAYLATMEALG